jgi:hypothetical protein
MEEAQSRSSRSFHDEHRTMNQQADFIVRKSSRKLLLDCLSDSGISLWLQPERLNSVHNEPMNVGRLRLKKNSMSHPGSL